jgi:hypothetical protein
VLLHIVGQHPGGIAVDYVSLAVVGMCLSVAFAYVVKAQPAPRTVERSARRQPARSMVAVPLASTPPRSRAGVALSLLGLSVLLVQGFHVIEHVVVVVQVEALGRPVAQSQGLLGARVDFEWLHLAYNTTFLATMVLLLGYGLRHRTGSLASAGPATAVLAGGVAMQSYHVGEHILRIIQYLNTGCTPCVGLIGQVVLFIWPHLFFGVFAYTAFTIAYFRYGLHRELLPQRAPRDSTAGSGPTARLVEPSQPALELREAGIDAPAYADATVLARASRLNAPALEPPALPEFVITRRLDHHG